MAAKCPSVYLDLLPAIHAMAMAQRMAQNLLIAQHVKVLEKFARNRDFLQLSEHAQLAKGKVKRSKTPAEVVVVKAV